MAIVKCYPGFRIACSAARKSELSILHWHGGLVNGGYSSCKCASCGVKSLVRNAAYPRGFFAVVRGLEEYGHPA